VLKRYFAIQAIGRDQPGLVADITGIVSETLHCNVETSLMTIIGGHFATTLIVSSDKPLEESDLKAAFSEADLETTAGGVYVSRLGEEDFKRAWRGASYEVSIEAPEQLGLVHKTSRTLAEHELNITNLSSACGVDGSRCTVVLELVLSGGMNKERLESVLRDALPASAMIEVRPVSANTGWMP
jgi:glycine cleavage system regulatory protein